jgi:hypothetical protein
MQGACLGKYEGCAENGPSIEDRGRRLTAFRDRLPEYRSPGYFWGSNQPIVRFDAVRYFAAAAFTWSTVTASSR